MAVALQQGKRPKPNPSHRKNNDGWLFRQRLQSNPQPTDMAGQLALGSPSSTLEVRVTRRLTSSWSEDFGILVSLKTLNYKNMVLFLIPAVLLTMICLLP